MSLERTQTQGGDEYRQAQQLSLGRTRPPADVPGYDPEHFLGAGAFGEVWVALDRNTGRKVAIKFYAHRGGLDWSLLSREVEKLVYLSADRYVVQLLDVGWQSDPPYYVMEYIENGSLDDLLAQQGTLSVSEALELFHEVAVGLVHAHGRGVLHCDLKPANVLLDQDRKPRLADFGQSRLSTDQDPALGTLFFMAPEQADLKAVPDACWDVYGLGSLLYTMLTGAPPHRNDASVEAIESAPDLQDRLARYRKLINSAPRLTAHKQVPGVDSGLAEIIDRCLHPDPQQRYPNAQAVVDALESYEQRKAQRRLQMLGLFGPILLVIAVGLLGLAALDTAVKKSASALTHRALESNQLAARAQADAVGSKIERRYDEAERLAADPDFHALIEETLSDPELQELVADLNDPALDQATGQQEAHAEQLRKIYREHPARQKLQRRFDNLYNSDLRHLEIASCFLVEPGGLQAVRAPWSETIGRNYAWRSYFHSGVEDRPGWRPEPGDHIRETKLSTVFRSQASQRWIACVSSPIYEGNDPQGEFLGVLGITFEIRRFVDLVEVEDGDGRQLPVLVDWRTGSTKGLILQHPLFDRLGGRVPDRFEHYRIAPESLPGGSGSHDDYTDPMGADQSGSEFRGRWLAEMAPVFVRGEDSGLLVIVQETYEHAIGSTLDDLRRSLTWIGILGLGVMIIVPALLWHVVGRGLRDRQQARKVPPPETSSTATTMATIADRLPDGRSK